MKRPHNWEEIKKKEEEQWAQDEWKYEFIERRQIITIAEEDELREKYKEKYGEYPPERRGTIHITNW